MEVEAHFFTTQKTVRYSTYGSDIRRAKYFWFVLHGSKMLSEQMIYKFSDFDPEEHFVVAPEALHRFYEKNFGGPVVASWMTKRDRDLDIQDNGEYLSKLYTQFTNRLPEDAQKIILGFSQGGIIAYRWLHRHSIDVDAFIPYACGAPEDIDLTEAKTSLSTLPTYQTYGTSDQFLTPKRIEMVKNILAKNKLSTKMYPYEGDHRIDRNHLKKLFNDHINI